jgi:hypothetical protein
MFRTFTFVMAAMSVSLLPCAAQAQSRPNVALSYSFERVFDDGEGLNLPAGWLLSVAKPLGDTPLSVVGEVGGTYRTDEGETLALYSYHGGIRATIGARRNVRPFAQFLLGATTATCCGEGVTFFSVEPGGGADIRLSRRADLRVGVSFPHVFTEGEVGHAARFNVGIVLPFGKP